ncbi:response regulator [Nostoc sp. UCD121]|nr:response regulator [Nostoc sp. UCD120]MBC1225452.1 response regulator [Nostoc sp. UCD120]MBC1279671.1 response regulator [Nostoc sp. UCD121]
MRQNEATINIPLIFVTAKAERSDFRQGMDFGADDYLTKPFTPEELLSAIASRLEKHALVER